MSQRSIVKALARKHGLEVVTQASLSIRRRRAGKGFSFMDEAGRPIRSPDEIARLKALAVPPAYENVRYAADPNAHLQATGEDAAGRLQYRYHPEWTKVREALKARRLDTLTQALPIIRRAIAKRLAAKQVDRAYAFAAVIELVALTAIRAGGEAYAKESGTRGATTLLKSNVRIVEERVVLQFKAKGGKRVVKEICQPRFKAVVATLLALPGRRLFQYRGEDGALHPVRSTDVNAFLREITGRPISLKDFRMLIASVNALEMLAAAVPATSDRGRRSQISAAVSSVAETLANTPTVCRKSYVHAAVVSAFEEGALARFADDLRACRSASSRADILAKIVASHG